METYTITNIPVKPIALVLATMGLLWGVFLAIIGLAFGVGGGPFPGGAELVSGVIGAPIAGLIIGILVAIFYNLAAVVVGGIELEME